MATLAAGNTSGAIKLLAGQLLTILAGCAGSASLSPINGPRDTSVGIGPAGATLGPYANDRSVILTCTSGTMQYSAPSTISAATSISSLEKLRRAIYGAAVPPNQVNATISAALNVTKSAQNGGPVSATKTLLSFPYDGSDGKPIGMGGRAAIGQGVWMGTSPQNFTNSNGSIGSPYWVNTRINNTGGLSGAPDVHFIHDGQYFEVLLGNVGPQLAIQADGQWIWSGGIITTLIANGVAGATMADGLQNCWVKVDMGSRATRRISLYSSAGGGICNIAWNNALDTIRPWDRSAEPQAVIVTDSYGQQPLQFGRGPGLYGEALFRLGVPTTYSSAYGGTGYYATATQPDPNNSFQTRAIAMAGLYAPDLVLIGGGINDAYQQPADLTNFAGAVAGVLAGVRAAVPNAVIAICNCFTPPQSNANYATTGLTNSQKAAAIRAAVMASDGPWVFVDPGTDEVRNSSGYVRGAGGSYPTSGLSLPNPTGVCWFNGTGHIGGTTGDGNGDIYSADSVHPSTAAASSAFGAMLAGALRDGILAL